MKLKQKINEWVKLGVITKKQQEIILKKEDERFLPFILFSFIGLGIGSLLIGFYSIIHTYWHVIPHSVKISLYSVFCISVILTIIYGIKKEKKHLVEILLFIAFFMIGGGIGLIAQLFNIQIGNSIGLLLWACLSLGIVLLSKKEFLFLLWIPLFIGGVLGFLKLELLLLFFEQSPIFATFIFEIILLTAIYLTKNTKEKFLKSIYIWSIVLYIGVAFLSDMRMNSVIGGFLTSMGSFLILIAISIKERKIKLFNTALTCVLIRFILLYIQHTHNMLINGIHFLIIGSVILLFISMLYIIERKINRLNYLKKNKQIK